MTGSLMTLEEMVLRLDAELREGTALDAYLLCAGIVQIADDYLSRVPYPLEPAAAFLGGRPSRAAQTVAAATDLAVRAAAAVIGAQPQTRTVREWRDEMLGLAERLAAQILEHEDARAGVDAVGLTLADAALPVRLREAVVKLPACFAHFDQRPADVERLAVRCARRVADVDRPLLIVGVRTSGSHLAPLCAAGLRRLGYRWTTVITVRPGRPLPQPELACAGTFARKGGLAIVIDDPPVTGGSVADSARQLERAGFARASILLLLAQFAPDPLPPALAGYEAEVLSSDEWEVTSDLQPSAVGAALEALLGEETRVERCDPLPLPPPCPPRGHARALFRVRTLDADGAARERDVLVEGVGLGYLGADRLHLPEAVAQYAQPVLGFRDGLLYREWLPSEQRLGAVGSHNEQLVAATIADYAAARRSALALDRDLSPRMTGEPTASTVAGEILSRPFGRAWPLARVLLTEPAAARVLTVGQPSVVDGNTDLAHWFRRNGTHTSLCKPDVGEDRFSNLGAACFDAVFDLAGASALADTPTFASRLRQEFADRTGELPGEERWLLYELVHLAGRERTQPGERQRLNRARARAVQRYYADVYLRDLPRDPDGPLCALDIDGVLENEQLGFPGMTPAAALSMRALLAHGYRPVLASGRCVADIADRCRAWGLAGGVAEYGSATFEMELARVTSLIDERAAVVLDRLALLLADCEGVRVDSDYRFSVRAYCERDGQRGPVPPETVATVLAVGNGVPVKAIVGEGQTDLISGEVNKGRALLALAEALGVDGPRPFVLAVGDTGSDLEMAEVSVRACAPRHADPALARSGFSVMSARYQRGLRAAVGSLIGHAPGACARCRMPRAPRERAILEAALAVREGGPADALRRVAQLGRLVR